MPDASTQTINFGRPTKQNNLLTKKEKKKDIEEKLLQQYIKDIENIENIEELEK